jgi:hypothetical protein
VHNQQNDSDTSQHKTRGMHCTASAVQLARRGTACSCWAARHLSAGKPATALTCHVLLLQSTLDGVTPSSAAVHNMRSGRVYGAYCCVCQSMHLKPCCYSKPTHAACSPAHLLQTPLALLPVPPSVRQAAGLAHCRHHRCSRTRVWMQETTFLGTPLCRCCCCCCCLGACPCKRCVYRCWVSWAHKPTSKCGTPGLILSRM